MLLLNGDCIEEMQKLIDDGKQVDSIVTDPPYHLTSIVERYGKENSAPPKSESMGGAFVRASTGFMGKEWDGGDIAFRTDTWKLAYDLLKPGGYLLAFSASRNYHRMAVAIEDAGFEIRDQIMWIYGSGFPKSLNIGKAIDKRLGNEREVVGTIERGSVEDAIAKGVGYTADPANQNNKKIFGYGTETVTKGNSEYEGWGTALKPAHEPVVMARKPVEGTVADNVLKHGTGGINIDDCRIDLSEGDDPRLGGKGTWKTDKMAKDVYVGGYAGEDQGSSELGRFPANVMHDGLEQEWARFFYCPKVSRNERNGGLENMEEKIHNTEDCTNLPSIRTNSVNTSSGKQRTVNPTKNNHPTVKPIELMKYLCRLVTPKGGTVLDPFMGSGSTGMAAKDEGFDFIGIEKEKEYFEIAKQRINSSSPLFDFL